MRLASCVRHLQTFIGVFSKADIQSKLNRLLDQKITNLLVKLCMGTRIPLLIKVHKLFKIQIQCNCLLQ